MPQMNRDHAHHIGPVKSMTISRSRSITRRKVPTHSSSSVRVHLSAIVEDQSKVDCINTEAPVTVMLLQVHHSSNPITRRTPDVISSNVIIEKTYYGRRKDIQDFLQFIRILLMRIKKRNTLMYDYSKKLLRQCIVMNRGHPELLRWSIEKQLRAIFGEIWNETERALAYSKVSS